jgi:hypothetical protein
MGSLRDRRRSVVAPSKGLSTVSNATITIAPGWATTIRNVATVRKATITCFAPFTVDDDVQGLQRTPTGFSETGLQPGRGFRHDFNHGEEKYYYYFIEEVVPHAEPRYRGLNKSEVFKRSATFPHFLIWPENYVRTAPAPTTCRASLRSPERTPDFKRSATFRSS